MVAVGRKGTGRVRSGRSESDRVRRDLSTRATRPRGVPAFLSFLSLLSFLSFLSFLSSASSASFASSVSSASSASALARGIGKSAARAGFAAAAARIAARITAQKAARASATFASAASRSVVASSSAAPSLFPDYRHKDANYVRIAANRMTHHDKGRSVLSGNQTVALYHRCVGCGVTDAEDWVADGEPSRRCTDATGKPVLADIAERTEIADQIALSEATRAAEKAAAMLQRSDAATEARVPDSAWTNTPPDKAVAAAAVHLCMVCNVVVAGMGSCVSATRSTRSSPSGKTAAV